MVRHRCNNESSNGNDRLQVIHNCNALYDMLNFVLIFPDGERGWHSNLIQFKMIIKNEFITVQRPLP